MEISTADAAERLGVHVATVRRRAAKGELGARKVAGIWMIESGDIASAAAGSRGHGRPISARSAWAILHYLSGVEPQHLSRSERQRARVRASHADELSPGDLAGRAQVHHLRGPRGAARHLLEDPRVVRSGASVAGEAGLDLIALDAFEGYVRESDLNAVVSAFGLQPADRSRADIILRVPRPNWPFDLELTAPTAVIAVDVLDAGDSRSVDAARQVMRRLARENIR